MKTIQSSIIGGLYQYQQFDDLWESGQLIGIPFFDNKKLKIIIELLPEEDKNFMQEADQALTNFLGKKGNDRLALSELAYLECMKYLQLSELAYPTRIEFLNAIKHDEFGKPFLDMEPKKDIWDFIYPYQIYVQRRYRRDKDIYVSIICRCEWEQEHGLMLVFRQGKKLTRISENDGEVTDADALDTPDIEDNLLSQF